MISFFSIGIGVGYALLILFLLVGWIRQKTISTPSEIKTSKFVSVIIPARNEENNILKTLQSIEKQDYLKSDFEIIVIDDASTDLTKKICDDFFNQHHNLQGKVVTLAEIEQNTSPKKRALSHGIALAKGDIIITTDADCEANPHWITAHVQQYEQDVVRFVSGTVIFHPLNNTFDHIQALEFMSLVASGAGAIGNKLPLMCNGANLSFLKSAFDEVGGYLGNTQYASGDDVFLMTKIMQKFGHQAVTFLKNPQALTMTVPKENLSDFLHQRIRWASKSKAYRSFLSIFSAIIVLLMNVQLFFLSIFVFFQPQHIYLLGIAWGLKLSVDFLMLVAFAKFINQQKILWYFLPSQLFVMIYTVTAGFLGIAGKFEWKGREYNN